MTVENERQCPILVTAHGDDPRSNPLGAVPGLPQTCFFLNLMKRRKELKQLSSGFAPVASASSMLSHTIPQIWQVLKPPALVALVAT